MVSGWFGLWACESSAVSPVAGFPTCRKLVDWAGLVVGRRDWTIKGLRGGAEVWPMGCLGGFPESWTVRPGGLVVDLEGGPVSKA
jgi:hypothetical protein